MEMRSEFADNTLGRFLHRSRHWPASVRHFLLGRAFGRRVPYFRTTRCRVVSIDVAEVAVGVDFARRTRNHVGGVHAIAATLAAETAAGLLVGQHVADSSVVVVKIVHMDLTRSYRGSIRARARVPGQSVAAMRSDARGSIRVDIEVLDSAGERPMTGYMEMVWLPKWRPGP